MRKVLQFFPWQSQNRTPKKYGELISCLLMETYIILLIILYKYVKNSDNLAYSVNFIPYELRQVIWSQAPTVFWLGGGTISPSY